MTFWISQIIAWGQFLIIPATFMLVSLIGYADAPDLTISRLLERKRKRRTRLRHGMYLACTAAWCFILNLAL